MKKSILRQIIKEEILKEFSTTKEYVVIGNAGRGRQNLWPNSTNPKLYTKIEAESIVKKQNDTNKLYSSSIYFHIQNLRDAEKYISPGQPAWTGIQKLLSNN